MKKNFELKKDDFKRKQPTWKIKFWRIDYKIWNWKQIKKTLNGFFCFVFVFLFNSLFSKLIDCFFSSVYILIFFFIYIYIYYLNAKFALTNFIYIYRYTRKFTKKTLVQKLTIIIFILMKNYHFFSLFFFLNIFN